MHKLQVMATPVADSACFTIKPSRKVTSLYEDVRSGLLQAPRSLPPKYFYDARGAQLFDQICLTPEYYLTRVEDRLLLNHAEDIINATSPAMIIELGSGSSQKTRRLFKACEDLRRPCHYAPFDVCEAMLNQAADELKTSYDWLEVTPLLGDYHAGLANLPCAGGTNLFVFLGSTIGNFAAGEAEDFIRDLRSTMTNGDYLLIGADRVKDSGVLNAAYNDSQGLTAEFNLNVLRVLNREIGSNFALDRFHHRATYNTRRGQIEMYLDSLEEQEVQLDALRTSITLEQGESILTEISRKFTPRQIESLLLDSGIELVEHYQPANQYFSLLLGRAA